MRTTAVEALALARGVCQDFVHVALGLPRALGFPRYASGYLHPEEDAQVGERVMAESHAWLDAWIGGWQPVDPTNGATVAERHVLVAHGHDYSDVTPFKGVYHGPSSEGVSVQVAVDAHALARGNKRPARATREAVTPPNVGTWRCVTTSQGGRGRLRGRLHLAA